MNFGRAVEYTEPIEGFDCRRSPCGILRSRGGSGDENLVRVTFENVTFFGDSTGC